MPQGTVTISGAQRQVFRVMVQQGLSGIGDVALALAADDLTTAARLGRRFGQDLRLLEDLGWGAEAGEVELTMAPEDLAGVLRRLRADAEGGLWEGGHEHRSRQADEETRERYRFVLDTCNGLLCLLGKLAEGSA